VRDGFIALVDPLRYPPDGLSDADVTEIRRIKARVDRERLPRGADPHTHLKLGRGGLADIEWTVQLLQLRYAGAVAGLRSPRTLAALDAARDAELITAADHDALDRAWRSVSRLRNAITLVTGRTGDQVPRDARERAAISSILGYGAGRSDEMVNDYLRTTRRARAVVDRVFWG
jgi:glutamate-ammonia-ligase adenylyltransferase